MQPALKANCSPLPLPSPSPGQAFHFQGKRVGNYDYEAAAGPVGKWNFIFPRDVKLKWLATPLVAAVVALSPPICFPPPAVSAGQTVDVEKGGSSLFRRACIGCHDAGGNIIQPGATLFLEDLQRNGVDTEEEIFKVTYYGKGRMPGFGEKCTPRGQCTFGPRLTEDEIKVLAGFVKSLADQGLGGGGWPSTTTMQPSEPRP
ncbi:cytochrome c6, chloroplastic isoform X2 [Andrographis paniculata]|uniref:cytochrome c6, chloroplastic isoform X2 n=1 Tax=Andrographis paniculata TaxID=175694 RepID=UPI0021E7472C|nr:cytochrome c6, chloroplastic isoform X2 [Andrographis paniculata]